MLVAADFSRFDLLLAMDSDNLATLRERCPPEDQFRLGLLLHFSANPAPNPATLDVPDPYYGSAADFDHALDLIEPACDGLLSALQRRLAASD